MIIKPKNSMINKNGFQDLQDSTDECESESATDVNGSNLDTTGLTTVTIQRTTMTRLASLKTHPHTSL